MFSQLEKSPVNVFRTKHHRRGNSSHTENKYEVTEPVYSLWKMKVLIAWRRYSGWNKSLGV